MAVDTRKAKWKEKDKNGNEVILRDAKLVEQTSETTIADTDNFEFIDADGNFVKVPVVNVYNKLTESIGPILADIDNTTQANRVVTLLSTKKIGSSSIKDFIKAIGALSGKVLDGTDVNSITETGMKATTSWQNYPGTYPFAFFACLNPSSIYNYGIQVFYSTYDDHLFVRGFEGSTFKNWHQVF